jgi:hypothetical protein
MGKCLPKSLLPHPNSVPCWMGSLKLYLTSRIWMKPFQRMSFCLQFQVMDPHFVRSDDPWHKAVTISLTIIQQIWIHIFPHSLVMVRLCGSQQEHIFKYPKASKMLFTVPLDTERSTASFLDCNTLIISNEFIGMLKQCLSECSCCPARATRQH